MIESILGISIGTLLGTVGGLAFIVSLITEVLKNLLPKKFPTKLLVMIISLILTIGFVLLFGGASVINGIYGAVGSFIVSFVSMHGWDSFKELYNRFKYEKENSGGGE